LQGGDAGGRKGHGASKGEGAKGKKERAEERTKLGHR